MINVSSIRLGGQKRSKQEARERIATKYDIRSRMAKFSHLIALLQETPISMIDRRIKHLFHLTFEEAFCGMCYALMATNNFFYLENKDKLVFHGVLFTPDRALATGTAFLQIMAAKESFSELAPDEVAGMVAAVMMDTVLNINFGHVMETSGMGGDIGLRQMEGPNKKTINASTLSAIVLASLGIPVMKHGSYGNTSAVGSTDAIEQFGAFTEPDSEEELIRSWRETGFCFTDAHWCKTVHDLSHLLMMETINHVIGPMTPPLANDSPISKIMGVNEKVHPEIIAKAYTILHKKQLQEVAGVAVVTGLDDLGYLCDVNDHNALKSHVVLDEVSPYSSAIAFAHQDKYLGTFLIRPADFGTDISAERIQLENDPSVIKQANLAALSGSDPHLADYLALNAALGMFVYNYISMPDAFDGHGPKREYLERSFQACRTAISSGKAVQTLDRYVAISNQKATSILS